LYHAVHASLFCTPGASFRRSDRRAQSRSQRSAAEARRDPLPIHLAKQAVAEIWHRFTEQREQIMSALARAAYILAGEDLQPLEGDHPIFVEIKRDLGGEQLW